MSKPCKDHLGNEYPSITAMYKHWGISKNTYKYRISQGMSIEEVLTTSRKGSSKTCTDHLGNKFPSIKAMCEYWNITVTVYYNRIHKTHMSIKEALETPYNKKGKTITDHKGNIFPSLTSMCKQYNISPSLYSYRRKKGWDLEKSLTTPVQPTSKRQVYIDHENNQFKSMAEMCTYWGIGQGTYRFRVNNSNWTMEKSLTTPADKNKHPKAVTIFNKTFENISQMCREFNIDRSVYRSRMKTGWSLEEALELIPHIGRYSSNLKITDSIFIKNPIKTDSDITYYDCEWNGQPAVMTRDIILNKARASLAETYA